MTTASSGAIARGGAPVVGRSVPRKEDPPLLTGSARFVDDLDLPGALHVALLRSPLAHAAIESIDVGAARARAGVVDVITAADLPRAEMRIPMRMCAHPGMERFLQPPLATEVVRFSGEPVAVVVASTRYAAEDALGLIDVRYEPLDPALSADDALAAEAPVLHGDAETNVATTIAIAKGDSDDAFAHADVVVTETLRCQRHAAVPMEPRGLAARLDEDGRRLTLWGAAKVVHVNRRILADLLGWPEERIRFIEMEVGGGFGARGEFYPEDLLIPLCALRTGRPIRWTADRAEELRALNHSREQTHEIAIAARSDGTMLALRDSFVVDTGAYVRTHGAVVPELAAALIPGPYDWRACEITARQVLTNKTPVGTYRAPGRYEANFARERMVDVLAHRLGRDPAELRRQNLIRPEAMPYDVGTSTQGHPVRFDSGDYARLVDKGLSEFGYQAMRRWRDEGGSPGHRRGVGTAMFVEKSGIARWEYARMGIDAGGHVAVHVGSASVGQGVRTVLAQIGAEALGVSYEDVEVVHGDTDAVPTGMGSFGSRATTLGGSAVLQAGRSLRERLLRRAAEELEAPEEDLQIVGDRVIVAGSPDSSIALADVIGRESSGVDADGLLEEESRFEAEEMSFPYGLHCVAVEVDLETGGVEIARYGIAYDVGVAINPKLVEGQVIGGAAQGIGGALLEEFVYDESGQLVSGSLMDYLLPTAQEVPPVQVLITEDAPTPLTPLGAKGAGEGGTAGAGAAIANAVSDALGTEAMRLPLAPERVLELAGEGRPLGP